MVKTKPRAQLKENKIDTLIDNLVLPCEKCARLGHTSEDSGGTLIMLTISPNPSWKEYFQRMPDKQKDLLEGLHTKQYNIVNWLSTYLGYYNVLSQHFEFAKNGNLHSHCIVEIPKKHEGVDRIAMTISKKYHLEIGLLYARSQICANTQWVKSNDVYIYLNKENAYPPIHKTPNNMLPFIINVTESASGESESGAGSESRSALMSSPHSPLIEDIENLPYREYRDKILSIINI